MRLLSLFLFGFIFFKAMGQEKKTFSIDWFQKTDKVSQELFWYGAGVQLVNGNVPVFFNQWEKTESGSVKTYSFENIQEKKIAINNLGDVDFKELPTSFSPIIRTVKERNVEFYSVEATPLYKNTSGEVIQVTSFDVVYTTSSNARFSQINSTKVIQNSVLSSGTWYKIAVDKSGVFKMDASFFNSIGIRTSGLDPKKIRVFGNGGLMLPELLKDDRKEDLTENAILVVGENDGVFNNEDYVLFYAQGPMGWKLTNRNSIQHEQNIYSDYAYYFINVDSGLDGKRISSLASVAQSSSLEINTFTDYIVHEKELMNYIRAGREWYGEDFSVNQSQPFEFEFKNLVKTTPVFLRSRFSASSSNSTNYSIDYVKSGTSVRVLNGSFSAISNTNIVGFNTSEGSTSFVAEADDLLLNITWDNSGDLSAQGHLDYFELVADRYLIADGEQFGFLNFNSTSSGAVLEYVLSNQSEIDYVWNVTDINNPKNLEDIDTDSSVFRFKELTDGVLDSYQTVKVADAYTPIKLSGSSNVTNQNLHALENIQYLIITQKDFFAQANRLADYHRTHTTIGGDDNTLINVEVVDLDEIYNEFGSGSPDITAIRDFVKYIYDSDSSDETRLKYLCLFGDASFDYKEITYKSGNIVPVYLSKVSNNLISSYNSDDYYAYLDENDDINDNSELSLSGKLDIVTGRIPVDTPTKAKQFVDKVLNYYSTNSFGAWKNKLTLLGDDGQEGDDQSLIKYLEESALIIEQNNKNLNLTKLYSDAFVEVITSGGGTYPDIVKKFDDAFNRGSLVINYFGHGNTSTLAEENFLDIAKIRTYRNVNNLPLFVTVTCDFSRFDDPSFLSAGEELIQAAYGGTSSMITTTREIRITSAETINNLLADYMYSFDGEVRTIAEALKDVKNRITLSDEFFVYFFGDPAMKLSLPKEGIEIDKIEKYVTDSETNIETKETVTELNGLSKLRVTGRIVEKDSVLNSSGNYDVSITDLVDFNGNLSVILYDKEIERQTLLNERTSIGLPYNENNVVYFKSLENKVFVGDATINDGKFSFDFILPKDVNTVPENAKFSFYASSNNEEKTGSDFSYKVGGIDNTVEEDNTPPVINLFMEDESFIDGGNTNSTPTLLAKLQDDNGINTSLNSIGHTISLVVDGDSANPITLNEYYTTEKDDFTQGIVTYELAELTEGNHTITLKAWDSHNNSSVQTLNFYVQQDQGFKISKVLNYPNPFINHTEFWFKNNRQGDPLEIKVQIYTVSGKLIKTIISSSINSEEIIKTVTWDGKDDFGNRLGKGVYLYKLSVKEIISGQSDEKVEKLVIL
ncbi:type IX secretion system sortase PorU [Wenyingzhuangia sp. 2_MG-2023]|uniref:type IX secretion system sortase PorU n=1 Tax=Wenyingzhuangia sp. 2_MG-2023 TaxID=3062639 RepID=UPI0026E36BDA|nr:type IX secretion system sortase PorU [Wenyingzhuangia sp. 2_MG-2023]MDO6737891.1 type IX secretion system sortase PorU [Wenyingzhuangia sp. 2_MG-2023]